VLYTGAPVVSAGIYYPGTPVGLCGIQEHLLGCVGTGTGEQVGHQVHKPSGCFSTKVVCYKECHKQF
jgi:hypothetical protein